MTHDQRTMAYGDRVPDVVPTLGFEAIDFTEQVLDVELPAWQRRVLIDLLGAGPEPAATPDGVEP